MNGFQIGSKRLKVQHKRVLGGPHTPGMQQHSMYGGGMSHHHGGPPMHMGHQQQHSPYAQPPMQHQQSSYGYRSAAPSHGMMMSPQSMLPQQQPYGSAPGMGLMSGGMGAGGYQQMQMRGGVPPQMGGMPAGGTRMQQPPQAAPMRGAYSYPSYATPAPTYAPAGQQQRPPPGVMVPSRGPQQEMMFGAPSASLQPPSPYAAPDPQQQQHANQSSLGAISYMDGNGGKAPQPPSNGAGGYYGQY
jgi:hypothetical protein